MGKEKRRKMLASKENNKTLENDNQILIPLLQSLDQLRILFGLFRPPLIFYRWIDWNHSKNSESVFCHSLKTIRTPDLFQFINFTLVKQKILRICLCFSIFYHLSECPQAIQQTWFTFCMYGCGPAASKAASRLRLRRM